MWLGYFGYPKKRISYHYLRHCFLFISDGYLSQFCPFLVHLGCLVSSEDGQVCAFGFILCCVFCTGKIHLHFGPVVQRPLSRVLHDTEVLSLWPNWKSYVHNRIRFLLQPTNPSWVFQIHTTLLWLDFCSLCFHTAATTASYWYRQSSHKLADSRLHPKHRRKDAQILRFLCILRIFVLHDSDDRQLYYIFGHFDSDWKECTKPDQLLTNHAVAFSLPNEGNRNSL